ncbi:MAG: hypothetical protein L3J47_00160 [Sulfurovum sp.]|nr:hypothetical protein [Sulfurovum sp.]
MWIGVLEFESNNKNVARCVTLASIGYKLEVEDVERLADLVDEVGRAVSDRLNSILDDEMDEMSSLKDTEPDEVKAAKKKKIDYGMN